MLDGVAGERGVVGFDVELEVVQEVVLAEEIQAGSGVAVILVRGGFPGLGLDVELALESDLPSYSPRPCGGRLGQVVQLALHVRVQQGGVALAAAPEGVAFRPPSMWVTSMAFLHLRRSVGEDVSTRAGGRALIVALVAEEAGRAPEELLMPVAFCSFFRSSEPPRPARHCSPARSAQLRSHVAVVEAVVFHARASA